MLACVATSTPSPVRLQMPANEHHQQLQKGPYTIIKELGSGLHGRVLLAYDDRLQRDVAVKLPAALTVDSLSTDRVNVDELEHQVTSIVHECNAMRRVQHPNVLQIDRLVSGKKGDYDYVAMVTEFTPNGDMFDLLEVGGALPEPLVKVYACQLLRALEACHANGVVHRDVKPENLLLDANYQLKLADFGVAAMAPLGQDATEVFSRDESGTALYMAPEIRSRRMYRGTPVDVWSAGVVLFILITGLPPFNEASKGDAWYDDLLDGDLEHFWSSQPGEVVQTITPGARDLISSMLVAPDERITVSEALQHPWLRGADCVDPSLIRHAVSTHLEAALAASKMETA
ncbi:CAMK protein kinase [Phytophthora nicotianae]|uniref:CAMK protein kinase n=2 Tax=Phytophthora nicotianae TaxID=4792 RepID=W2QKJ0_PHYN3|nr:CAMK protein kinase [Phytophthora nicotianae INRA-310]ETL99475.1 CAMK protein kinase [Phytophthora nicotianae]ETN13064.1 CAMK protein kinase [Phytophthora nicotianae INRA-310]